MQLFNIALLKNKLIILCFQSAFYESDLVA